MVKILIVFGTRPEAIKMAPLVKEFEKHIDVFETAVCVTSQHREMQDQVLKFFEIQAKYDLDIMKDNQDLFALGSDLLKGMKWVLDDFNPDIVLVHGDTSTSVFSALAAFYHGAKVGHVEAGLRTYNKMSPFPEEVNRQLTSRIADYHFAPTELAKQNLLSEGIDANSIVVCGNTVIDALLYSTDILKTSDEYFKNFFDGIIDFSKEIILVTGHRRENHGPGFENITEALSQIASQRPNVEIVYPVHLNPNVHQIVHQKLANISNVKLIEPLSYESFVWLMGKSKLILTDSGGIQEEAPSLGKPVLVMRENTERPEALEAGTVILVGTDVDKIKDSVFDLLDSKQKYIEMSSRANPFGDGKSSKRIVNFIASLSVD